MRTRSPWIGLLCAVLCCSGAVSGQTYETARRLADLQVFGMVSYVRPDFGPARNNLGGTFGGNMNLSLPGLRHLQPGLDVRYVLSSGDYVNERAFSGGPHLVYRAGRFQPYGDLLVGAGVIDFNHPYSPDYVKDNSLVYTYGGGVDVDATRDWALRVDVQEERWRIDVHAPPFHPVQASIGVRYQFHLYNKYSPDR